MSTDLPADFIRANQTMPWACTRSHAAGGRGTTVHRMRSDDRVNLYSVSKAALTTPSARTR